MKQIKRGLSVLIATMAVGPICLIADPVDMTPLGSHDDSKNEAPLVDYEKDSLFIHSHDADLVSVEIGNHTYFLSGNSATIDVSGLQGEQEVIVETENGVFIGVLENMRTNKIY